MYPSFPEKYRIKNLKKSFKMAKITSTSYYTGIVDEEPVRRDWEKDCSLDDYGLWD